jgi:hypothetical protein
MANGMCLSNKFWLPNPCCTHHSTFTTKIQTSHRRISNLNASKTKPPNLPPKLLKDSFTYIRQTSFLFLTNHQKDKEGLIKEINRLKVYTQNTLIYTFEHHSNLKAVRLNTLIHESFHINLISPCL